MHTSKDTQYTLISIKEPPKFFSYLISLDRKADHLQQQFFSQEKCFSFRLTVSVKIERLTKYLNHQVIVCAVKAVVGKQSVNTERMQTSYQKCFYHMKLYWFPSLVKCMQLDTTISLSCFTANSCIRQGQWPQGFFCFTKCNEFPQVKDSFK